MVAPETRDDTGPPLDELLVQVGHGARNAFAEFYDHTIRRTLGVITGVLKDPAQSEEVAQEVYLEMWQHAARFDPRKGHALSLLHTPARRRAIDRVRASQSSRNRDMAIGIRDTEQPVDDVAERVDTSVEYQKARRAMATLSHQHREVIELIHDHYLTQAQTAESLGIPIGTVKSRLRDALIALRRELADAV
jgi:RNA polymerase sigma-70 factor (ECF subfamily)